tara:strand:- start:190 stop:660 length:471 start_codon:yes stop_codon:yes gene_type:complete
MGATRTIALIPWYQFLNSLLFWQAVWFVYFQSNLSGAEAIILYSAYDISVTVLEVPSGYFSDRIGRRFTLLVSTLCSLLGCLVLALCLPWAAALRPLHWAKRSSVQAPPSNQAQILPSFTSHWRPLAAQMKSKSKKSAHGASRSQALPFPHFLVAR